ncbi:MAG: exodeoxyribonuclease VII small subunit [Phycisphaerae bacterium]|nr:exodeoxyribonuclease VII small subunit [Phycisphaerae bacterium]
MAKKQNTEKPFDTLTFEQAIERLGDIVQKIETGQVPLEESLRQYEQGMGLIGHCRKILLDAERRIERIGENVQPAAPSNAASEEPDESEDEDADEALF